VGAVADRTGAVSAEAAVAAAELALAGADGGATVALALRAVADTASVDMFGVAAAAVARARARSTLAGVALAGVANTVALVAQIRPPSPNDRTHLISETGLSILFFTVPPSLQTGHRNASAYTENLGGSTDLHRCGARHEEATGRRGRKPTRRLLTAAPGAPQVARAPYVKSQRGFCWLGIILQVRSTAQHTSPASRVQH